MWGQPPSAVLGPQGRCLVDDFRPACRSRATLDGQPKAAVPTWPLLGHTGAPGHKFPLGDQLSF